MIDKSKIIQILKGYSTLSPEKDNASIDDKRINELAGELTNLFITSQKDLLLDYKAFERLDPVDYDETEIDVIDRFLANN